MKKYAIALAFKGKLLEELLNAWNILDKEMKINSISSHSPRPHITINSGELNNIDKIIKILKKIKFKKFKIMSLGIGIFANKEPTLYLRWEQNNNLQKLFNLIHKKTSKLYKNKSKFSSPSFWIPKTTIAMKDTKYSDLELILKKINFLSGLNYTIIDSIIFMSFDENGETFLNEFDLK